MNEAPRIDKDDVRELLGNPDVSIIDLRSESDWQASDIKIRRAVHEDRDKIESWFDRYDRNKTLILYCA